MKRIGDFIETRYLDLMENKPSVYSQWEYIAGADIAEHSEVLNIDKGKLIIYVDHPGWKQIILAQKSQILARLKKEYQNIAVYGISVTDKKPKR